MYLIVLVLGMLLAAAGSALVGFGILFNELPAGTPWILAGVLAVSGGFLLIGQSVVVVQLARIGAALKEMHAVPHPERTIEIPAPQPDAALTREHAKQTAGPIEVPAEALGEAPRDQVVVPAKEAVPTPAVVSPAADVSASAIERLRSIIARPDKVASDSAEVVPLSPNGQLAVHHVDPAPRQVAAFEAHEPRLDFLFRPRPGRPVSQPQEAFESLWPTRTEHDGDSDPRLELPRPASSIAVRDAAVDGVPGPAPSRAVTILKSGVVDGMAYTLYGDGSIEAQLPQGTVRFGSIAELRAHIESNA
jgi:hypothetical protein